MTHPDLPAVPQAPDLIPHVSEWGDECDCDMEEVTPAEQQLLTMFDAWYGDKAYRKHDEIVGWAAKLTHPLLSALAAAREELAEAKREEERYRHEARDDARAAGKALRERDAARAEADRLRAVAEAARAAVAFILEQHPQIRDAQAGWFHGSTLALVAAVDALAVPTAATQDDEPSFSDDVCDFVEQHGYILTDWQKRYLRAQFAEQEAEYHRKAAVPGDDGQPATTCGTCSGSGTRVRSWGGMTPCRDCNGKGATPHPDAAPSARPETTGDSGQVA